MSPLCNSKTNTVQYEDCHHLRVVQSCQNTMESKFLQNRISLRRPIIVVKVEPMYYSLEWQIVCTCPQHQLAQRECIYNSNRLYSFCLTYNKRKYCYSQFSIYARILAVNENPFHKGLLVVGCATRKIIQTILLLMESHTPPWSEPIYNSHYGNEVPAMFAY